MKNNVFATPKFILSILVFFTVCVLGVTLEINTAVIEQAVVHRQDSHIRLLGVENDTDSCEFEVYYGSGSSSAFVFPQSVFKFEVDKALPLDRHVVVIKCCKGSFVPVYIQNGSRASGEAIQGYDGPFYISMWLSYPQVPEISKLHVRYVVKKGSQGLIGIKIGNKGDYRFVAYENVKFLS